MSKFKVGDIVIVRLESDMFPVPKGSEVTIVSIYYNNLGCWVKAKKGPPFAIGFDWLSPPTKLEQALR
jgi:hypothetical protein